MAGTGPVALNIDYQDILGRGGQGLVLRGRITNRRGLMLKEVGTLPSFWKALLRGLHMVVETFALVLPRDGRFSLSYSIEQRLRLCRLLLYLTK